MMAADGRCKTFDAAADGYVRGEGCGMVILKRVSDALADGDRILAVIRGTAVNQDGRSSGLTVPNGPAQEAVVKQALANGGVAPAEVAYVEAHGTGTSLGDPIEIHALGAVLGEGRSPERPLLVGSVKTNVGHLEAAAGIAGLIKVVLALQHDEIPPHLHFRNPSPHIAWGQVSVAVPTVRTAWPANGRRIAGISSFGFSGTNSHVVLEEAPTPVILPAGEERPLHLLTVSAKDEEPLRVLARAYEAQLAEHTELSLADVAFTANAGRAQLEQRLTVVAASGEEARARRRRASAGARHAGTVLSWCSCSPVRGRNTWGWGDSSTRRSPRSGGRSRGATRSCARCSRGHCYRCCTPARGRARRWMRRDTRNPRCSPWSGR